MAARAVELRALGRRARHAGLLAVVTGAITGLAVALFDLVVDREMFGAVLRLPLWAQAIAPVAGLALAAVVLRLSRVRSTGTTDEYIRNFHDVDERLDLRPVPARLLASVATLGSGAAMGFEGPSMYIGAAIGTGIQRRWSRWFSREDNKLLMVCGAAAGVAAIFKAPATGVVFALEVPYQQDLARRMLLPAMFSAAAGYVVFAAINGTEPLFPVAGEPPFDLRDLGGAALLGLLAGLCGRVVSRLFRDAKRISVTASPWVRAPIVAGGLVGLFVLARVLTGESLATGPGYGVIEWALAPDTGIAVLAALFVVRLAATTIALGGGGVGGLFVPLVVQGALLGAIVGAVIDTPERTLFPLLGVAALLGAGYRVPLAAVVFVAETTGRAAFVVPGLIAAATSQLLMGGASVSPYQQGSRRSLLERRLALPVTAALRPDATIVPPDATLTELFDYHVSQLRLRAVPVVDGNRYCGMVHLDDVTTVPRSSWPETLVADVLRDDAPTSEVTATLGTALRLMEDHDVDRLPILQGDAFVGIVTTGEILKLDAILDRAEELGP